MNSMAKTQIDPTLVVLALLGQAETALLSTVIAAGGDMLVLESLLHHDEVHREQDQWIMADDAASAILSTLEQNDPAGYRQWHERVLLYLSDSLQHGNIAQEARFITILDRLVTHLAYHDAKILETIMTTIQAVPLVTESGQQSRRYFEGFTLWRLDRHQEALAVFETLLNLP